MDVLPVGKTKRKRIKWNEFGQPIGKNSINFSSTVGVLVRQNVPITISTWRKVSDKIKEELWILILVCNFLLPCIFSLIINLKC